MMRVSSLALALSLVSCGSGDPDPVAVAGAAGGDQPPSEDLGGAPEPEPEPGSVAQSVEQLAFNQWVGGPLAPAGAGPAPATAEGSGDDLAALRAHCGELAARAEKDGLQACTVQHLLVSFGGRGTSATRSQEEAEALAADLWRQIQAGADFDQLIRDHTDDSPPGIYKMVLSGGRPPQTWDRRGMVAAFGDVGWRLDVGEFGVAPFSPDKSTFGWHIIKRTE